MFSLIFLVETISQQQWGWEIEGRQAAQRSRRVRKDQAEIVMEFVKIEIQNKRDIQSRAYSDIMSEELREYIFLYINLNQEVPYVHIDYKLKKEKLS